jgi:microcystin-dependent protein
MVTLVNRAKANTSTTGTGTLTLGFPADGYQSFAAAGVANGDTVRYVIEDGNNWEIGTGVYTSTGATLSRTVSESSNSGAAINLSGDAVVYVTAVGADIVQPSDIGVTVQAYDANIVSDAAYVHTDNNYTTAEKSKLAGIEAGATADQTASEILTAVKTVDGSGSGLDADLLDGIHASSFLQGNQTITLSGDVSGSGTTSINVTVADDSHNHIIGNVDGLQAALDGKLSTTGKAADSNLLDGLDSTSFLRSNATDTFTTLNGTSLTATGNISAATFTGDGSGLTGIGSAPASTVIYVAQSAAPTGYVKANGAALSRTTYAALFAAIGTTFGVGDGSTTFNVPDLRGEFLRGWDDGRGVDSGRVFGSAQGEVVGTHSHRLWRNTINTSGNNPPSYTSSGIMGDTSGTATYSGSTNLVEDHTGVENRPRNVALLACIKF